MGCSVYSVEDCISVNRFQEIKRLPDDLRVQYESYKLLKNKITALQNDINLKFRDDYKELIQEFNESTIHKFLKMYENTLISNGISKDEMIQFINENKEIKKFLIENDCKTWKVHDIFLTFINGIVNPEVSSENKSYLKLLLEEYQRFFPKEQKGIYGLFEREENDWRSLFRTLKFNSEYNDMKVLNFRINSTIKDISLIKSFSEVIQCNFNLITLILNINFSSEDFKQNTEFLENFCIIINVIKEHNNLRNLVLIFEENEERNYQFPQMFFDSIYDILRKNILIGLVLHGITMSTPNGLKLSEVIGNCVSLKFFSLKSSPAMNNYYDDFILNISKNKTLTALNICGGNMTKEHIKSLITKMQGLRVFDYREKLI